MTPHRQTIDNHNAQTESVRTGICKGGPMDGQTITGGDVMHFAFDEIKSTHRYQYDRGTYRHQGRRTF
jgi:hypothetical protein